MKCSGANMLQDEDCFSHIPLGCVYSGQVWHGCFERMGVEVDMPHVSDSPQSWWFRARNRFGKKDKRGFDRLKILICWRIWKQRYAMFFQNLNMELSVSELININEDGKQWKLSGIEGVTRL